MSKNQELTMAPFDPSAGKKTRKVPLLEVAKAVGKRIKKNINNNNTFDPRVRLKFDWVPISKVWVNYGRQRFPEPKHQLKVYGKWNLDCVTPLQCRWDPVEDRYYVSDGQQHGSVYVMQYGSEALIPVFYVESTDENIESLQLLALNTDSEPMAKYFIHQTAIQTGDAEAIALEKALTDVDCFTSYKKKTPGAITHITWLYMAASFGLDNLKEVLGAMRRCWPQDKIEEAILLGFLKLKELMEYENCYTEELLADIVMECSNYFASAKSLRSYIDDEFAKAYPTNYRGMGAREKHASGFICIYQQVNPDFKLSKPFDIFINIMLDNTVLNDIDEDEESDDELV